MNAPLPRADGSAARMADAVRRGEVRAIDLVEQCLSRITSSDARINAFTDVVAKRAGRRASELDSRIAADPRLAGSLPLAGVPFAVKNLFDVEGLVTRAGSRIELDRPPASRDALLVRRLEDAGAILVGCLNMDEYAYGFTTENSHYGPTRNPHDPDRIAGGSSGGCGAAIAAAQVPVTLGSDTNGSIRVPSSLCGTFGLRPTYGRLPRTGSYPFVASLDVLGPFARSAEDLALAYDALQGHDDGDPACARRPVEPCRPTLGRGADGLRIAVLGGYFLDNAGDEARAAVDAAARALGANRTVTLPEVERARAAAFVITNSEGAALHLEDLRTRACDFEPLSRDRFLAGALLPAAWVHRAQRFRGWFAREAARLFLDVDVLIAPATPVSATLIGQETMTIAGREMLVRPNMGLLTQPLSCIGLPICAAPIAPAHRAGGLPIGVQLVAAPWREDLVLRAAQALESLGVASSTTAVP